MQDPNENKQHVVKRNEQNTANSDKQKDETLLTDEDSIFLSERDSGYFSPMNNSNFVYVGNEDSEFDSSMDVDNGATASACASASDQSRTKRNMQRTSSRPIDIPGRLTTSPERDSTYESNFTPPRYHMQAENLGFHRHSTSSLPLSTSDQSSNVSNRVVDECAQWQRDRMQLSHNAVQNRHQHLQSVASNVDRESHLPSVGGRYNESLAPLSLQLIRHYGQELRRVSDEFHLSYTLQAELARQYMRQRNGFHFHGPASFPLASNEGGGSGWRWQEVVQSIALPFSTETLNVDPSPHPPPPSDQDAD